MRIVGMTRDKMTVELDREDCQILQGFSDHARIDDCNVDDKAELYAAVFKLGYNAIAGIESDELLQSMRERSIAAAD